jgi:hypothetical protein
MDDYKRFFYVQRMGLKDDTVNVGDLSDRKELRKRLNCQSFKWYLDNVIPEKFIPDENVKAYGLVRPFFTCPHQLSKIHITGQKCARYSLPRHFAAS